MWLRISNIRDKIRDSDNKCAEAKRASNATIIYSIPVSYIMFSVKTTQHDQNNDRQ